MKFCEKLQKLRKDKRLSQEQLAEILGVSRQSVSKWESGQTYPEMDKLLIMCKFFKCTLDDLINDEVGYSSIDMKSKNELSNLINEVTDIISKSYTMFKNMEFRKFLICFGEMLLVVLLLRLLNSPINHIYFLGENIFINFGEKIGNLLSSIWYFILEISYLIGSIMVFIYIYKIRYLDKNYRIKTTIVNEEIFKNDIIEYPVVNKKSEDLECNKTVEHEKQTKTKQQKEYSKIFNLLVLALIILIKIIVFLFQIPFIVALFLLVVSLIISVIVIFKGAFYIGIIIIVLSAIVIDLLFIEIMFNTIVNKKTSIKKVFNIFIYSTIGFGIGFGITMFDVANIKYINNVENLSVIDIKTREYNINDKLIVDSNTFYYEDNFNYIIDESLDEKIRLEIKYHPKFINISIVGDDNVIRINPIETEYKYGTELFNIIVKDLSKKRMHNYDLLYKYEIKVYGNSKSIEQMKLNKENYIKNGKL